jgi:hypothetical protein
MGASLAKRNHVYGVYDYNYGVMFSEKKNHTSERNVALLHLLHYALSCMDGMSTVLSSLGALLGRKAPS